eukprot:CAMPEP_0197191078 /NCGR_PEP_ID=MMETSP1423-20130617/22736_1 /TAXON_ID=476441 /ORGANISM="Pseudo-nitzschia heimii, Strain UNC1101" /LENGTH=537 /DNA_ID=CAMNT_0042643617 /DNA_START=388 /DNA_END=2001 /DNA_ORIENTATION=+
MGKGSFDLPPFHLILSRSTILADSVTADQEVGQMVAPEQDNSGNNIQSSQTAEATSAQSKASTSSPIEVLMGKNQPKRPQSSSRATATSMDDKTALLDKMKKKSVEKIDEDVPQPTANGGFSHTKSSRAKISAANKGKTPWNKGKPRSPEVKARIAAGVRARNRQVFLKKLEDMGMTEEEYEAKKKEERRIKDAERRARRTANGGYRPTEETKKKISRILKEKHAKGEVKARSKPDPNKVRKGFTHSEETRKKISQSLRKRWKNDEGFQKKMKESFSSRETAHKRISESLKKRWQEPEFRRSMMEKMSKRKAGKGAMNYDKEHRKKISEAMKRKWQDANYREKTLSSIKRSARTRTTSSQNSKITTSAKTKKKSSGVEELKPITTTDISKRKAKKKRATRKRPVAKKITKNDCNDDNDDGITLVKAKRTPKSEDSKVKGVDSSTESSTGIRSSGETEIPLQKEKKKKKKKEKDGSVTRLREERRDLFDLLYGDEDEMNDDSNVNVGKLLSHASSDRLDILLGDEDLDSFDPYGLDDY